MMQHQETVTRWAIKSTALAALAFGIAAGASTEVQSMQDVDRTVISVGGPGGLLNHRALPIVRSPHGYQGEALRLHNKYLHAGLTKRNVFRSSRQFSPFGNVFRSSRHYQQKLAASIDAYPLRTIGHPVRVIGNDFDEVVAPSFIAGAGGRYGGHAEQRSPFDAAHHYFDPDLASPTPYYGHYEPDVSHYGPSNFVSRRENTRHYEDSVQTTPAIEWRNEASDVAPSQQAVTIQVTQPDGSQRIVITSEPIPSLLNDAWAALGRGDDADAAAQFGRLGNQGGHETGLSQQATLGLVIAQAAQTLTGPVNPDRAVSELRKAIEDDADFLTRLPNDAGLRDRMTSLAERMDALAETSASGSAYAALADAMRQSAQAID